MKIHTWYKLKPKNVIICKILTCFINVIIYNNNKNYIENFTKY